MKHPKKSQIKITKKQKENAKKVLFQVAINLSFARANGMIKDEIDEFMFIVANSIEEWEKIRGK